MTKTEIVSLFRGALVSVGYEEARIRKNYDFCDLTGPVAQLRRIPLAAFAGYPQSYQNARVGIVLADEPGAPNNYRALGAPLLLAVQQEMVQPWAAGVDEVRAVGQPFRLRDTARVFKEQRALWGPEALGRVKRAGDMAPQSQPELFDTGLAKALEKRFQTRLKELLEHSFAEIASAYGQVHGRAPKVSPLFSFLFRFVTAKIFKDRADATGWDELDDPLEILKAAEKQTGLLDKPQSDFRRKPILDAAWHSISSTLHFQNLSVPDLAFVAESAFITDRTREELGVHSTPAGLADYIVNQLPWDQVPPDERVVWEPFCGHGIFLAKAMERLAQDIDPSLSARRRHQYFRDRLIGVETDPLSLEICRLVLTLSDYPNDNSWQLHHADVFAWPEWEKTLKAASTLLANPPYEAFTEGYRKSIGATKTKPPAELLHRLLQNPPRLLGLVLPQSFLSDPIYRDANREMARRYDLIQIVELPRIFRYADNETVAIMASGLRVEGRTSRVHYAEVPKDGAERFLEDWRVSATRTADVPVSSVGARHFTLRLLPQNSIFGKINSQLKLGDVVEIHKGVNWIKRTDRKPKTAPRTDVASDTEKEGFRPGAEKMNGNLAQFQLRTIRNLSLLDKHQDPSTQAHKRPWGKPKAVCNAARLPRKSPWRIVTWADTTGLAFTKQFFAAWPREGVSEFAIAAILASPIANAFSFERDLDRHNHIGTLDELPLPAIEHLRPGGELHRRAAGLQEMLVVRDFVVPPTQEAVLEAVLRLDAAVLAAYNLSASVQRQLLKMFNGWARPLSSPYDNAFTRYFPEHFDEEITLAELLAITTDWECTSERKTKLIEKKIQRTATPEELGELQRLKFLTEARGEYFAPLPVAKLAAVQKQLESAGKWEAGD
jgi:hypothetical protein